MGLFQGIGKEIYAVVWVALLLIAFLGVIEAVKESEKRSLIGTLEENIEQRTSEIDGRWITLGLIIVLVLSYGAYRLIRWEPHRENKLPL